MRYVLREPYGSIYESYTSYVKERYSSRYYKDMKNMSRQILQWFEKEDVLPEEVGISEVLKYKHYMSETVSRKGKEYSAKGICHFLKAGRGVWEYLVKEGRVKNNPFREVPYPREVQIKTEKGSVLSAPYADIYEMYTEYAKKWAGSRYYQDIKNMSRQILQWLDTEGVLPEEVGISEVLKYKRYMSETVNRKGKEYSAKGICHFLKAGRGLWEYLVKEGRVKSNPFREVPYPREAEIKKQKGSVLSAPYQDIYESYIGYEERRISRRNYPDMKNMTRQVLQWFDAEDVQPEEAGVSEVMRYKQSVSETMSRTGTVYSTGAICNFIKAGRRIWDYLVKEERVKSNPFREVRYPRVPNHLSRNFLSESQMNRLLERLIHFEKVEEYQVHVVSEFLYATGLRIQEAASLELGDIDTEQRVVYVREGKGGNSRTAFLTGYAAEVMEQYVKKGREAALGRRWRKNGDKLFGYSKSSLARVVSEKVGEICKQLEQPEISCHGFRHSLGTHLLRAGCDMRHIQVILGHDSLNSTQVYTRVDKDDLRESIDSYHPRKYGRRKGGDE